MGDTVAVPDDDGNARFGQVTVVRSIRGFGLTEVYVRLPDGTVEQRVLPDSMNTWVMPDLPPDRPVPPSPQVREHIWMDALNIGDTITRRSPFGWTVTGTVTGINRDSRPYAEVDWYTVTMRDTDGVTQEVMVGDRG